MRVRAAVLADQSPVRPYDVSNPLTITELELDPPQRGEVLVAVGAAGLCHSDLSTIDGTRPRPTPMVLGHEVAGEVVEVGEGVDRLAVGDHVVVAFVPSCGACVDCARGRPALCSPAAAANTAGTLLSGGRRIHDLAGSAIYHHLGVSGFSEHIVIFARSAVRVDSSLSWDVAALFGCAVLTGVGAVVNAARVGVGESVAVFGLGGVGLAALLGAVASGADPIFAIDPEESKRTLALELGASEVFDATEATVGHIRDASGGGVAHAIETVGSVAVLAQAYLAAARGGMVTTVGLPRADAQLVLPAVSLTAEEKRLQGSYLGSCVPDLDIPRFIALYQAGKLPVDRLLTHRFGLDEINAGFERMATGEGVRQAVVFRPGNGT